MERSVQAGWMWKREMETVETSLKFGFMMRIGKIRKRHFGWMAQV